MENANNRPLHNYANATTNVLLSTLIIVILSLIFNLVLRPHLETVYLVQKHDGGRWVESGGWFQHENVCWHLIEQAQTSQFRCQASYSFRWGS